MSPGESLIDFMTDGIKNCDSVLVIVTAGLVDAVDRVKAGAPYYELRLALERHLDDQSFRVIPLLRQGCERPSALAGLRYVDFREDSDYTRALEELVKTHLSSRHSAGVVTSLPYQGEVPPCVEFQDIAIMCPHTDLMLGPGEVRRLAEVRLTAEPPYEWGRQFNHLWSKRWDEEKPQAIAVGDRIVVELTEARPVCRLARLREYVRQANTAYRRYLASCRGTDLR